MKLELMLKALKTLDEKLVTAGFREIILLIGGGAAFTIGYQIPLQTADIDGVTIKSSISPTEWDQLVKQTAAEMQISPHWLNPYFETYLGNLPADYGNRLTSVFQGKAMEVFALGMTDLLIMKCFAGREKDMPHAKSLIKKGADLDFTENHLRSLEQRSISGAKEALEFLIEAEEQVGG